MLSIKTFYEGREARYFLLLSSQYAHLLQLGKLQLNS